MDVTVACLCPPTPQGAVRHPEGERITLRDRLDFHGAITCQKAITILKAEDPDVSSAEVLAVLTENYVLQGIVGWSVVDARGRAIAPLKSAIRELLLEANPDAASTICDAADGLYQEQVLLPLLKRASASSPATPTDASTSASQPSPTPLPRRSKRSSTSTSRTDGIVTTISSPAGVSSLSPNSGTAA